MAAKLRYVNTPTIKAEAEASAPGYERNLSGREVDLIKLATRAKPKPKTKPKTEPDEPVDDLESPKPESETIPDETVPEDLEGNEALSLKLYYGMGYGGCEGFVDTIKGGVNAVVQWVKDFFKWIIELFTSKSARTNKKLKDVELGFKMGNYVDENTPIPYNPSIFDFLNAPSSKQLPSDPSALVRRADDLVTFGVRADNALKTVVSGWLTSFDPKMVESHLLEELINRFGTDNGVINLFDNFGIAYKKNPNGSFSYKSKIKLLKRRVVDGKTVLFKRSSFEQLHHQIKVSTEQANSDLTRSLRSLETKAVNAVKAAKPEDLKSVKNTTHNILLIVQAVIDTITNANRAASFVLAGALK